MSTSLSQWSSLSLSLSQSPFLSFSLSFSRPLTFVCDDIKIWLAVLDIIPHTYIITLNIKKRENINLWIRRRKKSKIDFCHDMSFRSPLCPFLYTENRDVLKNFPLQFLFLLPSPFPSFQYRPFDACTFSSLHLYCTFLHLSCNSHFTDSFFSSLLFSTLLFSSLLFSSLLFSTLLFS